MRRALAAIALLTLSLAACAREGAPPATSAPPAATASVAAAPAVVEQAARTQESLLADTSGDRGEAALERLAALPAAAQLPGGRWKAGENYRPIVPAISTSTEAGQIEVLEFFWYGCPHCYALDPFLESWRKNKPANVKFVRVPVMWAGVHRAHARLYYALQALGKLEELHTKVFDEIQRSPASLGSNDEQQSLKQQTAFAVAHGISAANFQKAWSKSFAMDSNLRIAEDLSKRYAEYVQGVPSIIVNGKYFADVGTAGGHSQLVQLINDLVAAETRR